MSAEPYTLAASEPVKRRGALQIRALHTIYCNNRATSHVCLSLCDWLRSPRIDVRLMVPATDPAGRRPFVREAVHPWLRRIAYRLDREGARIQKLTEARYLRWLRPGDVAYLWPGTALEVYQQLNYRGHAVIAERINCHRATSQRILAAEYDRLGWPPAHGIRDADVEAERCKLALADFVFAPSPHVQRSLERAGVPASRILPTSYGWDPRRFSSAPPALPRADGLTVLFVGYACVRKGAHLLLAAWSRARLRGRLVLAGRVAPDIATHCADLLNRPDVVCLPHTADVGPVYRSADVFALPTLEEGSPLVSYEALAHGLPLLISPMGAGDVVRHEREGLVIDPHNQKAWIAALHHIATDRALRECHAKAAGYRAGQFTWPKVAARRRAQLEHAFIAAAKPHPRGHQTRVPVPPVPAV